MAADPSPAPHPWPELIGQQAAVRYLRAVLAGGRLGNGYLFSGPAGVGKRTGALCFAQVLLCHHPPAPDAACGNCKSCRWLAGRNGLLTAHPDLLLPLKRSAGGGDESLVADRDPQIGIETVQGLCAQLHRAPLAGPRRVALVPEADRMCRGQAESANSFLKTLEEPPASSIILLTSSRPEGLLETIVSRVQPVRFRRLAESSIREYLERRGRYSAEALALAAALADGSLGRAQELLDGDLNRWRQWVVQGVGAFGPRDCPRFGLALWRLAEEEGKRLYAQEQGRESGSDVGPGVEEAEEEVGTEAAEEVRRTEAGWSRHVFGRLLDLCEVVFRDALVCAAVGEGVPLLQPDSAEMCRVLSGRFGMEGCEQVLRSLEEARGALRLYIRGDLVGRVLAGRMVLALGR